MPRGRPRLRRSRNPRNPRPQTIYVELFVLGNAGETVRINKGTTIAELFGQTEFEIGETVRMNGRDVTPNTRITQNGAVITSTSAVKGG